MVSRFGRVWEKEIICDCKYKLCYCAWEKEVGICEKWLDDKKMERLPEFLFWKYTFSEDGEMETRIIYQKGFEKQADCQANNGCGKGKCELPGVVRCMTTCETQSIKYHEVS